MMIFRYICKRRKTWPFKHKKIWLSVALLLLMLTVTSADGGHDSGDGDNGSADNNNNNGYYFTRAPTYKPTPYPTRRPTSRPTAKPTSFPTPNPTPNPTQEPTRAGDDFYEIENDDGYTAEATTAKIYFSSITDVILCLMCTFFWVLWLVGTIFPTKIQHLYKTEGIVVQGYVVESYVSNINNHQDMNIEMDIHNHDMAMGAASMGEMDDDMNDLMEGMSADGLPQYHAIVSYVVPGRIASGLRWRRPSHQSSGSDDKIAAPVGPLSPVAENYVLQPNDGDQFSGLEPLSPLDKHSDSTNINAVSNKLPPLTPPRYPTVRKKDGMSPTKSQVDLAPVLSKIDEDKEQGGRKTSLLDAYTRSFESVDTAKATPNIGGNVDPVSPPRSNWQGNTSGYYKYNKRDESDYETPLPEEDFEDDPELIGNLFYHFGLIPKTKRKALNNGPVRVKKRFETHELLEPGTESSNVEIIVLPGNPGSGILKSDFEQDEDYKMGGGGWNTGGSLDDEPLGPGNMNDVYSGMIGVVLAAVSVIGAVHGALTLPYQKRIYGWVLVIVSLSMMWPLAMLCYKTVNKLRLFMMNKIINLEPCGDKTNLYGLSKLPRTRGMSCSDKGSDTGNEYIIMLDNGKRGRGVWHYDEGSAMSSLSENSFPRETGLLLYRRLVKDQIRDKHCQFRKQVEQPSDRERKRVLEILSLLPGTQQTKGCTKNRPPGRQRITHAAPRMPKTRNELKSPYGSYSSKQGRKNPKRKSTLHTSKFDKKSEDDSLKLMRNKDYMWHPIRMQTKKCRKKNEPDAVVQDVIKYYQSQYHQCCR